jgi:hypothetical protein
MFLIFSGCTTTQTAHPGSPAAGDSSLNLGDDVMVVLKDGRELKLTVIEWTGEELVGRDQADMSHTFSSQDISQLDVTRYSPVKTTLLVLALSGIVLAALTASAYGAMWSGPIL